MKTISIIIPAKNESNNIDECLNSLLKIDNNGFNLEIILVDNGSTDDTVEKARLKNLTAVIEPNATIAELRNIGVRLSRGEILAFIDADVFVSNEWLVNALYVFDETGAVCVGSSPELPQINTWVERAWQYQNTNRPTRCERPWLPSMNLLVTRDAFLLAGGFNSNLRTCEDVDFGYRIGRFGKIVSDKSIRAVHVGEAKNIYSFFKKESWRGISNFHGLIEHGLVKQEIPSNVIAIAFLSLYVIIPLLIITFNIRWLMVFLLISMIPASIKLVKLVKLPIKLTEFVQLFIVWYVYCWGRGYSGIIYLKSLFH